MVKSRRKKDKGTISAKILGKNTKGQTKATECVSSLLELHKLQGALLNRLSKEV